jgi:hypothetical protein
MGIVPVVAALALMVSQVLDWHSTLAFLRSGHGREGNGLLARLQRRYGASRVMIVKGLMHLPIAVALLFLPPAASLGVVPFLIFYGSMIAKNYRIAGGA